VKIVFLGLAALALSLPSIAPAQSQASTSQPAPGGFLVSPTAYNINPANSNTSQVRFENRSGSSTQFRVEVMQWTQVNGQNVYSPTRDVVANPLTFTLAPQQAQVIRVGVLKRVGSDELTYRVFVNQLPPTAEAPALSNPTDVQVQINRLARVSLPVYVTPAASTPRLTYAARTGSGSTNLEITNAGNRHLTLRQVSVELDGKKVALGSLAVLGKSMLAIPLGGTTAGSLTLSYFNADEKEIRETVSISP
jgi:fimbrial chaperone protein